MSLRDTIRLHPDTRSDLVDVPEWDVKVEVRSMTGTARAQFLANHAGSDGQVDFESLYPELVIHHTYDPDTGDRVFEEADRDWLMAKNGEAIDRIAMAAMKVSGLGAKAVDQMGKPSSASVPTPTPSADSTSS